MDTFHFVDIGANASTVSMHGSGKVRLNGTGAVQIQVGPWICNPHSIRMNNRSEFISSKFEL